jgi:hypothetical protein
MKTTLILLFVCAPFAVPQSFRAEALDNPAAPGSLQPNWSAAPDGSVVLSWIEPSKGDSYSLRYAVRRGAAWSEPHTIAANRHFFRQPAEVPEVIALGDKQWLAHWVEMPNESSEAEFIYTSSSADGVRWTPPVMAHQDRSPVQHGLASMIPSGPNEASIFWLEALHGEDEPTYLMRTIVDASGKEIREERLAGDVCSCCPTAVVKTAKGLLLAYRDHTPQDIRDISILRFENGRWSQPKNLHADNWHINACPTNAAAVAAKGDRVAVSWFTGATDPPKVEIAFSSNSGSTFTEPTTVSTGLAFGYTSIALDDDGSANVSWLEQGAGGTARVLVRRVSPTGTAGPVLEVAKGGRMSLGYPRVQHAGADTFIAWGGAKLQTARLQLSH